MIDLAITGTLLLSIALLCVRRMETAVPVCAMQALLAACVLGQRLAAPAAVAVR
ncbi:MAG TPA: hypothetical protein VHY82_06350 [Acetobacteraceae bacterium]|nr:hypothetical protein [Acetobacteraceae bacterium]